MVTQVLKCDIIVLVFDKWFLHIHIIDTLARDILILFKVYACTSFRRLTITTVVYYAAPHYEDALRIALGLPVRLSCVRL